MLKFKLAKPVLVALAACAASITFNGAVFADDDAQTQALKEQMRIMQQQMQQLQKQIDALSSKQAAQAAQAPPAGPPVSAAGAGKPPPMSPLESKIDSFLKGFYGALDLSVTPPPRASTTRWPTRITTRVVHPGART